MHSPEVDLDSQITLVLILKGRVSITSSQLYVMCLVFLFFVSIPAELCRRSASSRFAIYILADVRAYFPASVAFQSRLQLCLQRCKPAADRFKAALYLSVVLQGLPPHRRLCATPESLTSALLLQRSGEHLCCCATGHECCPLLCLYHELVPSVVSQMW